MKLVIVITMKLIVMATKIMQIIMMIIMILENDTVDKINDSEYFR